MNQYDEMKKFAEWLREDEKKPEKAEKEDARIRYTKMRIIEAMSDLLQEKPLSKITVTAICEKAEINRATFYRHYKDPYDLAEQLQLMAIHEIMHMFGNPDKMSMTDILATFTQHIYDNRDAMKVLFERDDELQFASKIAVACYHYFAKEMERRHDPLVREAASRITYSYVAGGSTSVLEYWIRTGMKDSPREVAESIMNLINNTLQRRNRKTD